MALSYSFKRSKRIGGHCGLAGGGHVSFCGAFACSIHHHRHAGPTITVSGDVAEYLSTFRFNTCFSIHPIVTVSTKATTKTFNQPWHDRHVSTVQRLGPRRPMRSTHPRHAFGAARGDVC
ncbi:hypothetical protein PanWU01x14_204130 [Parasponia andersonii]|uniref:Uncharacterized protein n=1 Tax=Parasponia andersonii TaxID=3476 RepID=A0A2P5BWK3_PARAD|nr:hypothetical protein PanWU01x14_204130 [Parasponia andersonii]